jgi:hypothetical protein
MTKLESILKFVYAKGMENYIKSRRTEEDGLKVVNQAIEKIKAMIPEEKDVQGMIEIFGSGSFDVGLGCGRNETIRQINKKMDEEI